jgi:Ca-activated chloride channel homolog
MQADFTLDYDVLSPGRSHKVHLLARLVSEPVPEDRSRRPLNLSLVIDRSGSMAGEKLSHTRQAAQFLVQNLGAHDILSVVLYNDTVETLLMPENVQRKDVISQRIATIKPGGTTNLSSGWLEGCNLVARNLNAQHLNRVILMSDGLANRGVTDSNQLVAMARQKFGAGISTTTMGMGSDFNEDLLMAMASAGGGAYYFIESPEVAPLIFQEELRGLLNLVGQNLTITIEPTEAQVTTNQLNAYPADSDGPRQTYRLGDVYGNEIKALLLEITIPAIEAAGQRQIAVLRFEYDELTEAGVEHRSFEYPLMVHIRVPDAPQLPDPEVSQSLLLLRAAQARRSAVTAADQGDFQAAVQALRRAANAIEQSGLYYPALLEEQNALVDQATSLEQGAELYDRYSRKSMSSQALYTMTSRHEDTVMLRGREQQRRSPDQASAESTPPAEAVPVERRTGIPPTYATWNEHTFALEGDLIRIGRSKHNEIVINAEGVSRFHCHIQRKGDQLLLEDLGSTNGTVIDGVPVKSPHALSVGDVAQLCDEKLIFHDNTP